MDDADSDLFLSAEVTKGEMGPVEIEVLEPERDVLFFKSEALQWESDGRNMVNIICYS